MCLYLYLWLNTFLITVTFLSDFRGEGQTVVADGKIVDHLKLNLKDIEISGIHLSNVEAVVIASQNAPLLLGQSAIQKLGRIQLNGDILVLLDRGREATGYRVLSNDSEINGLVSEADELFLWSYIVKRCQSTSSYMPITF